VFGRELPLRDAATRLARAMEQSRITCQRTLLTTRGCSRIAEQGGVSCGPEGLSPGVFSIYPASPNTARLFFHGGNELAAVHDVVRSGRSSKQRGGSAWEVVRPLGSWPSSYLHLEAPAV
jgi:hypothetical protein